MQCQGLENLFGKFKYNNGDKKAQSKKGSIRATIYKTNGIHEIHTT